MLKILLATAILTCTVVAANAEKPESTVPTAANLLTDPVWVSQLDQQFLRLFYPDRAFRMLKNGFAVVSCTVADDGKLNHCKIFGEQPRDEGFGFALTKIATKLQVEPSSASGAPTIGRPIKLGARFTTTSGLDPSKLSVELVTVQQ